MAATASAQAQIRVERVEFASAGERIIGALHLPEGSGAQRAAPAVIVTGAWMTVKEQMPSRYAREMAERGFVALAFDFRGWGESGGARRQLEDPAAKIEDIRAAAAYLATRPEADVARLGALGICASAGYVAHAAATTPLIHSVALVAPWLHDREIVEKVYGGAAGVAQLEAAGAAAEAAFRASERQVFLPAASMTDERAIMFRVPYYTEAHRGMIATWRNEADPAFWRGWLAFDAMDAAPGMRQSLLVVHSEAAAIPQGVRRFVSRLPTAPKEVWLPDVTQFDFYDRAAPVRAAADAAAAHFRATLASAGGPAGLARPLAPVGDAETARVISVVSSIPLAVDLAAYDLAERAFAPQVVIDYTSLWGGQPQTMTPSELMTAWRGIVPGFDTTWHELSDVRAEVRGERATATAFVDGRHWIGERLWRPVGLYEWDLARQDGRWRVTRMAFRMTQEIGERALAEEAQRRAAGRGVGPSSR